jgi:uncharacterized protein (TIGR02145 family)
MKRILFASIATILAISLNAQQTGTFKDSRDGKTYKTVKIGTQIWMAENLAYKPSALLLFVDAYDDKSENIDKYGYLYGWKEANLVCPDGWHLPSKEEWNVLSTFVGNNPSKLKTKSGWINNGNGTDDYGFSILPGGGRWSNGSKSNFANIGATCPLWTATEYDYANAWRIGISNLYDNEIHNSMSHKISGFYVRCLKD